MFAAVAALVVGTACQHIPPRIEPLSPSREVLDAMAALPVISFVIPVGQTSTARRSGSAVILSDRRLIFTLHQVDEENDTIRFSEDHAARYTVIAGGDGTSDLLHRSGPTSDDWVVVVLDSPVPVAYKPAEIDWKREVAVGEPVYLVGYPFAPAMRNDGDVVRLIVPALRRQIIAGRVAPRPAHRNVPRDMLFIHRAAFDGAGLSGGAAAVWDAELGRPVIIGIVAGRLEVVQGPNTTTYAMVVRPPTESVTGADVADE